MDSMSPASQLAKKIIQKTIQSIETNKTQKIIHNIVAKAMITRYINAAS
jgi:hypothetical protein